VFHFSPCQLPAEEGWLPMDTETLEWAELVPISPAHRSTRELHVTVIAEFHATLSRQDCTVHRIYRVQNLHLWNKYRKYVSANHEYFLVIGWMVSPTKPEMPCHGRIQGEWQGWL